MSFCDLIFNFSDEEEEEEEFDIMLGKYRMESSDKVNGQMQLNPNSIRENTP